jgi:hypothetical protein
MESRTRITTCTPSSLEIVVERMDPGSTHVGIPLQVPVRVEERIGIATIDEREPAVLSPGGAAAAGRVVVLPSVPVLVEEWVHADPARPAERQDQIAEPYEARQDAPSRALPVVRSVTTTTAARCREQPDEEVVPFGARAGARQGPVWRAATIVTLGVRGGTAGDEVVPWLFASAVRRGERQARVSVRGAAGGAHRRDKGTRGAIRLGTRTRVPAVAGVRPSGHRLH